MDRYPRLQYFVSSVNDIAFGRVAVDIIWISVDISMDIIYIDISCKLYPCMDIKLRPYHDTADPVH